MSLFGAMSTAISGLNVQSAAFSNIGDNVANSQTVGFKRTDTTFEDYLTSSTADDNQSGAVVARPDYANTVQGTISQTDSSTDLAVSGQGFFVVQRPNGSAKGAPTFQTLPLYTRNGNFSLNKDGYLVNSSGDYLSGWIAGAGGTLDQTKTAAIQIGQSGYSPVATTEAALAANLPASADGGSTFATQIPLIDALGRSQTLNFTWTKSSTVPNSWSVAVTQGTSATVLGTADVAFGSAGNAAAAEGTVSSITNATGALTGSTYAAGETATLGISLDFGAGTQSIALGLGHWGQADGLTQYSGTTYSPRSLSQNGVAPGSYSGVAMKSNGDVVVNYDNGQSRVVARVPLATFANPDALQRQDGQAFTATTDSGSPQVIATGGNGAGTLVTSSVETSNVDIAQEFTKLIVAQRAYSANTKLVTTADELLQSTIDMKR